MPCDRLFALIEKKKKTADVFIPTQWLDVIRSARPTNPFTIVHMENHDFFNFEDLLTLVPRPSSLKITENCWYYMNINEPAIIRSKTVHNDGEWNVHIIRAPTEARTPIRNRPHWNSTEILRDFVAPRKYRGQILITAEKYRDLQAFLPLLEPQYRDFYIELPYVG